MDRKYYIEMLAEHCPIVNELVEPTLEAISLELEITNDLKPAVRAMSRDILTEAVKECFDKYIESDEQVELLAKVYSSEAVNAHDTALDNLKDKASDIITIIKLALIARFAVAERPLMTEEEQLLAEMKSEDLPQA